MVHIWFVDLEKAYDRVPRKKLSGVLRESGFAAACYWPSSHCIPAQMFVSVSGKLNHDRSTLVLDSDNGVCCHRSFSYSPLHELDRQLQLS